MFKIGSFFNKPVDKSINYVLANSLTLSRVHLLLDQWFIWEICVSYFTKVILGSFGNVQVSTSRHYLLYVLMSLFREYSLTN